MSRTRRLSGRARILQYSVAVPCTLLVFYFVPLEWQPNDSVLARVLGIVAFIGGVLGLVWITWRHLNRYLRSPKATGGRVDGILLLLCVVVMFFALYYYRLAITYPEQFDGLVTRTDALYYTIVTLGTVGYGDIHATGQEARIATMIQIVFDLVVIGTLLAILSTGVARRLENATLAAASGEVIDASDTSE